ncbi:MAG: hypothetical protein AAF927_04410 [Bacteroidota bacterium]
MHHNKAFQLLRTFSTWELRSLDDFLRSPFFNKQEIILKLWENIWPLCPLLEDPMLERHALFQILWPDESFHERRLRYLLTDFARLIERFWAYKDWSKDVYRPEESLLWAYQKRGLSKYQKQTRQRYERKLEEDAQLSAELLQQRFQLAEFDLLTESDQFARQRSVQEVLESLDEMYLLRHLRYACEGVNRARIFAESPQTVLTPLLLDSLKNSQTSNPLIEAYRLAYLMLTEEAHERHYFALKALLWQEPNWALLDLDALHSLALNYCIGRLNAGAEAFRQETFEVYRHSIEKEILLPKGGILEDNHYKNLVSLGTRLKLYEWTENFINAYRERLYPTVQENAYRFNMAYLLMAQSQYSKVMRLIAQVEFTNVFYQLGAKTILARVYYETEEYESLFMLLKNFRAYLSREKSLSSQQRVLYQNFVRVLKLMGRYQSGDNVLRSKIEKTFAQYSEVAAKQWVEEKLALI